MVLSLFLAKLLGVLLVVKGITVLANLKYFARLVQEFARNEALLVIALGHELAIGLLLILTHNVWVKDWPVVITLIGWAMVLKGIMIISPKSAAIHVRWWADENRLTVGGIVATAVGAFLVYIGFIQ